MADKRLSVMRACAAWLRRQHTTIRYDTIAEFIVDSKAEYTA